MKKLNKDFCLIPFNSISISPRGVIRACCWQGGPKTIDQPNIKNLDEKIIWPTEYIVNLQQKMLSPDNLTSTIPECISCWNQEKNINWSQRKLHNQLWFDKLNDTELQDLIDNPKITTVDMQFGYLCNNSCLMCTPAQSSHLYNTYIKLENLSTDPTQKNFYKKRFNYLDNHKTDWTDDPESFNKIKNLCTDVTHLKISGGEPLMNPNLKSFLEFVVSKKVPLECLRITTNGTIYDQDIVDLINRVPNVDIKISLENLKEKEEFIRWPTVWEEKKANINQFLKNIKSEKTLFVFSSVVQPLNILDLAEVKEFVLSLDNTKNIKFQLQSPDPDDYISLYHTDNSYLDCYLNLPENKKLPQVTQFVNNAKNHQDKQISKQIKFIQDMMFLQKKNLEDVFPIYYQHHRKYF